MRRSNLSTLALTISLVLSGTVTAQGLSRTLPSDEIDRLPDQVRFLIYDSPDANLPIEVAEFGPDQYTLEVKNGQAAISAELLQEIDTKELWIETELDSQPKGERVPLAVASPGITFATGNNLNMEGNTITGLSMPVPGDGTDAANRDYVDGAIAAGGDNLGDHTATQNISLGSHYISADGSTRGFYVKGSGSVEFSKTITVAEDALVSGEVIASAVRGGSLVAYDVLAQGIFKVPYLEAYIDTHCYDITHEGKIRYDRSNGNFLGCSNDANDNGSTGDYGWMKLH